MAKSLVLGNGSLLVALDGFGRVTDFYFPYVGLENHAGSANEHKIGVYVDGSFSWISSGEWKIAIEYVDQSMMSKISASNERLGITLDFSDIVYNERNLFLRRVFVRNERDQERSIRLYFAQNFSIGGSRVGNTAYVTSDEEKIIHYKERRVFLISGCVESSGRTSAGAAPEEEVRPVGSGRYTFFDQYSVGLSGIEGREGTWRDAEDGELSRNTIEHGAVDSVIGFTLSIPGKGRAQVSYWVVAGETLRQVATLHVDILARTPSHFLESTRDYWHAWLSKREFIFEGLSERAARLFNVSLLVVRAHTDNHGAIIASGDSDILQYGRDTYSYAWPRDGSFAALALDKAGYYHVAERFYNFCNEILTDEGYMLHKYNADKSFGSSWHPWVRDGKPQLAIQEDETALVLTMLWEHYEITRDLEFIERIYNSFIRQSGDFLVRYRNEKTGLPLPSYDLWEERHGVHCFTASVTVGALTAAAHFAAVLGKEGDARRYHDAASAMRQAILDFFWVEKKGYFVRSLWEDEDGSMVKDETVDASSAYGVFRFDILPPDDPRLVSAYTVTLERLGCKGSFGGFARYEGDRYHRVHDGIPGNPWFITTLWYVEYLIARAKREEDLLEPKKWIEWTAERALYAGMLPEQINPDTGAAISVAPLTWSHARYILAVIAYLEKLEELGICKTCYPVVHEHGRLSGKS